MQKARVNISEAARLAGKDRKTVQRHMSEGKNGKGTLSFDVDEDGRKFIDVAELQRFYGELRIDSAPKEGDNGGHNGESPQHVAGQTVELLQQRVTDLERENGELRRDKEEMKKDKESDRKEKTELMTMLKQTHALLPPPQEPPKKKGFLGFFGGGK